MTNNRITFDGSFSQVVRRLDVDSGAATRNINNKFQTLLRDIGPEIPEKKGENRVMPAKEMASVAKLNTALSGLDPVLLLPQIEKMDPVEIVNESTGPVKKPTLIDAYKAPATQHQLSSIGTQELKKIVTEASNKHGVDPALSMAVASIESSFLPNAISNDGHSSKGLFQLLDSTGKHLHNKLGLETGYNPFSPELNTKLGVSYLKYLNEIFATSTDLPKELRTRAAANSSDLERFTLAAFNAGEGRVASAQERAERAGKDPSVFDSVEGYLPEITRSYVKKVLKKKDEFIAENNNINSDKKLL